jgi:hypothetical protein
MSNAALTIPEIDERFVDIGNLPSNFACYDFDELYLREFDVNQLRLLNFTKSRNKPMRQLIRVIQLSVAQDVLELTDGDFEFLLAWLRKNSYPEAPVYVNWECRHTNLVYSDNREFYLGPPVDERDRILKGLEHETCNTKNVELVRAVYTEILYVGDEFEGLPYDDLDFPRVRTLSDMYDHLQDNPHDRLMAELCRWIKGPKTFKDKLDFLLDQEDNELYERLLKVRETYKHGILERMNLCCRECQYRWTYQSAPKYLTFFADNADKDIQKIQYNLLSEFSLQPDMSMPSKSFLYHHSKMIHDKREAEERKKGIKAFGE